MNDPEIDAAVRELARLRHEFADLTNPKKDPVGPPEFMQRYLADLKRRMAELEREIDAA